MGLTCDFIKKKIIRIFFLHRLMTFFCFTLLNKLRKIPENNSQHEPVGVEKTITSLRYNM